jgi:hypothetical protein
MRRLGLRHFAVSSLITQGADIKLPQAIAGHASATVTLDTYGHLTSTQAGSGSTCGRRACPDPDLTQLAKLAATKTRNPPKHGFSESGPEPLESAGEGVSLALDNARDVR